LRLRAALAALVLGAAAIALPASAQRAEPPVAVAEIAVAELPREALVTLALIHKGGPFPYAKDGAVFGNREGRLPGRKRGYYREYTVKTPGERTRGARRIISGGGEFFYTDDHYNHLRRIRE
jgi:ribonuclease T1